MDEAKLCRICCVASTVFYPLVFITIFWGLRWAIALLLFSLFITVTKIHFSKVENYLVNIKFAKITLQFLIFNCVFGIWYLSNYLYNKDSFDEMNFIFNVSWILLFSIVSVSFIIVNWQLYLIVVIFIGIMQNMIQST